MWKKLQTFHHSKPHKGSPLKDCDIAALNKMDAVYDPRPPEMRNTPSYPDFFRNQCINFQCSTSEAKTMPVVQLYAPANPKAVALDHDYMEFPMEEWFMNRNLLTSISVEQARSIESSTRGQATNKSWQIHRQMRITSSKFGSICKATERRDLLKLAHSLTDDIELHTAPIIHGRKYESVAVEKFEQSSGQKTTPCGLFVSTQHASFAASPDRIIDNNTVLEVKCPYVARDKPISHVTVPYLMSSENGTFTLHKNHDYYYQVQGQMYCANRTLCKFVVYTLSDLVVVDVPRDQTFIDTMLERLVRFNSSYFRDFVINKYMYKNYVGHTF